MGDLVEEDGAGQRGVIRAAATDEENAAAGVERVRAGADERVDGGAELADLLGLEDGVEEVDGLALVVGVGHFEEVLQQTRFE